MATAFLLYATPSFLSPLSPIPNRRRRRRRRLTQKPFSSSSFRNGGTAETECPVPLEQQPINEYQNLSTSFPFSWASGDLVEYCSRLIATGACFALFVGLPVASFGVFGAQSDPLKQSLYAVSSGFSVVTLFVLRMYLGWAYIGNRLLSATVEYEETGWYDGQIWVKTAEVLARDRLLGSFSVKPVLSRLKLTLVTLAASILACVLVLLCIDGSQIQEAENRVIRGVYNDDSARSFEPDAFCSGEPDPPIPSNKLTICLGNWPRILVYNPLTVHRI